MVSAVEVSGPSELCKQLLWYAAVVVLVILIGIGSPFGPVLAGTLVPVSLA